MAPKEGGRPAVGATVASAVVSAWVGKGSVTAMAENVKVYMREKVILAPGYPWDLMFLHAVKSVAAWRAYDEANAVVAAPQPSVLYNLVCAFLCHGFGGTTVRDLAMAQTPSLFKSPDLGQAWLLAFACVYYSPFDALFTLASTPRSLSSMILTTFEAVDSATTLCGSVDKGRALFPDSPTAPFVASMLAGVGGSLFRYLERRNGRGWTDEQTEWARPTETMRRTLLYTVLYMWLSKTHGADKARLWITTFHIGWCLSKELVGAPLDFTEGFL